MKNKGNIVMSLPQADRAGQTSNNDKGTGDISITAYILIVPLMRSVLSVHWKGLMLKLKLQYFGYLMQRDDSFEKTLMLEKIEGQEQKGTQRMG